MKTWFEWMTAAHLAAAAILLAGCGSSDGDDDEPVCGNDRIESGEECDKTRLDGKTCADFGFDSGTLACSDTCTFDTAGCEYVLETCPDGDVDPGEDCDGNDLGGATCEDLGFTGGELACDAACKFDVSGCEPKLCGNGQLDPGEACDPAAGALPDCTDLGFSGGALSCTDTCTLDAAGCTGCQDDGQEENDDMDEAAAIGAGSYQLALCNTADEEDWFALEVASGGTVLARVAIDNAAVDVDLELIDADGNLLDVSSAAAPVEQVVYEADEAATVYLRLFTFSNWPGATGYTLTVIDNPECLEQSDCAEGEVCQDFCCTRPTCGPDEPCPGDLVCHESVCVECVEAADCPDPSAFVCQDNLCLFDCAEDDHEPNSTPDEPEDIVPGFSSSDLTLCGQDDEDWFAVEFEALHLVEIHLGFTHADGDIDVALYESGDLDVPVAVASSATDDEVLEYAVGTYDDGVYLIRVMLGHGAWDQGYSLSVTDGGAVECAWREDCDGEDEYCIDYTCVVPACTSDAGCTAPQRCVGFTCVDAPPGDSCDDPVLVGEFPYTDADRQTGPYRNEVEFEPEVCTGWGTAGEDVVYQVTLTAGQTLHASVEADFDAALTVIDACGPLPLPAGSCLAGADEGFEGEAEQVSHQAEADGTLYVVVDTFAPLYPDTGSFTLHLQID